ncbi:MAG: metallophosphoesterase family protein [Gammaproteobacteria bacterium]
MKIAVLSDVHGNVPALEAVLDDIHIWEPDQVIVNGDLVSRGPYSLQCLRLVQARLPGCRLLKGNHESFVLSCADQPRDPAGPTFDLDRFAQWTAQQLGAAVEEIRAWDDSVDLDDPDGGSAHVTHGSRLGNREGIYPQIDDELLAARLGEPRDLFVGSHTHMPLLRRFNGTLVANTGSVGQPLDGDPRAAYGRFAFRGGRWHAEIARIPYDKARAERDFAQSGFLEQGGPLARLIHLELQQSRMLVGTWMRRYLQPVRAGEITVAAAVDAYLQSL